MVHSPGRHPGVLRSVTADASPGGLTRSTPSAPVKPRIPAGHGGASSSSGREPARGPGMCWHVGRRRMVGECAEPDLSRNWPRSVVICLAMGGSSLLLWYWPINAGMSRFGGCVPRGPVSWGAVRYMHVKSVGETRLPAREPQ